MNAFLLSTLSAIVLLALSTLVFIFAKRFRFPYTVALVATGILIAFSTQIPLLSFLDDFQLTPELLLYIFLPILLFEAAYNIDYKDFFRNLRSISALAVISLIISACLIWWGLQLALGFVGIVVPFTVTFLFGTLISATDPVAVLALFKELGAPKRLTLIFEGESLFNDGTALALFLVVLGSIIALSGGGSEHLNILMWAMDHLKFPSFLSGSISFLSMIIGGVLFGALVGFCFSQLIGRLKNEEFLELALTLSLAHMTFIGAEILNHFFLPISGVIATTIAAMVLGNYGRYKISPLVEKTMGHYWEFFAFLANSLVFMLVGIMVVGLDVDWTHMALPILLAVLVTMIARAISIYSVVGGLNALRLEEYIPLSWQHLLSWGSLRWALAVIMVLLIPEDMKLPGWTLAISIHDFVLALTVGCIVFTTFVKATTIFPIMKYFGLIDLEDHEEAEYLKWSLRMLLDVASKLEYMKINQRVSEEEISLLQAQHKDEMKLIEIRLGSLLQKDDKKKQAIIRQIVARHALGLEYFWLKELYAYGEIPEQIFKTLLRKVSNQSERVKLGKSQIRQKGEIKEFDMSEWLSDMVETFLHKPEKAHISAYLKARTRNIVSRRVLRDIEDLEHIDFLRKSWAIEETRAYYEQFELQSKTAQEKLYKQYRDEILPLDSKLANKALLQTKMHVVEALLQKGSLSPKIASRLKEEVSEELFS